MSKLYTLPHCIVVAATAAAVSACSDEADGNNVLEATPWSAVEKDEKGASSGDQQMTGKTRPWDRPDVEAYWPDPVETIQYDPKELKAVDTATGEFIVMRPGMRGGPGQFLYGTESRGWIVSGGYTSGWHPDVHVSIEFINALRLRSEPEKRQSRAEFDAAPIARMMRAFSDAARKADSHFAQIRMRSTPIRTVVIDTRQ